MMKFLLWAVLATSTSIAAYPSVPCPHDASVTGFAGDWMELKRSIESVRSDEGETTITLCPHTTVVVSGDDGVEISITKRIKIRCGPRGLSSDDCCIGGGDEQFAVTGLGAEFLGITFWGAGTSAVDTRTDPGTYTRFVDCIFEDNVSQRGASAANVYEGGHVAFEQCTFRQNVGSGAGAVTVTSGNATFNNCLFEENSAIGSPWAGGGSAISVDGPHSVVTISNSCFVHNSGPSTIFYYSWGTNILLTWNNYGKNNTSAAYDCQDIFLEASNGICQLFDATSCGRIIPIVKPAIPSNSTDGTSFHGIAPSVAPIVGLTLPPTSADGYITSPHGSGRTGKENHATKGDSWAVSEAPNMIKALLLPFLLAVY